MFKKSLLTIVLVAIAIFAFGIAQATQVDGMASNLGPSLPAGLSVHVNPGATGDALIYGYYNARGAFTNIRVINTSDTSGIAAKVRFREGVYSNEVLDFFICLSPDDQWTAWVIDDGLESNPAVMLPWDDDTPTYPATTMGDIISLAYNDTGAADIVTADMTKEGYLEIIAVSSWIDGHAGSNPPRGINTSAECGAILGLEPPECDMDNNGVLDACPQIDDAPNALAGTEVIFNVAAGSGQYALNASALADCTQQPVANPGLATDNPPRLSNCDDGINGVNYALTKYQLTALYDNQLDFLGASDIINTFPTKRESAQDADLTGLPFHANAIVDSQGRVCIDANANGACEEAKVCVDVIIAAFDDEEHTISPDTGFSPGEPEELEKCDEVSYLVVGQSASPLLNTTLRQFNINTGTFEIGLVKETFANYSTTHLGMTTMGLPVISYELGSFIDGDWTWMLPVRYITKFE
jgi:hypothetical protein